MKIDVYVYLYKTMYIATYSQLKLSRGNARCMQKISLQRRDTAKVVSTADDSREYFNITL